MRSRPSPSVVVVDTREQTPFEFRGITDGSGREYEISTCRAGLKTGDYSLLGLEDAVAIERKSKSDLFTSVGRGRDRFEREIERMAAMPAPALVLECDLASILRPPDHSRMSPASVLNSLIAWSIRYRIPVWPCPNRRFAEILAFRLLEHYRTWRLRADSR